MKSERNFPLRLSALVLGASLGAAAGAAEIRAVQDIERVKVQQVSLTDDTVRAIIVNDGEQRVEDLLLRVTYQWRWRDEHRPGNDNPGWSTTVPVASPLAPGESREFEFAPTTPVPARDDGSYAPEVSVVSFTAYSQMADTAANQAP